MCAIERHTAGSVLQRSVAAPPLSNQAKGRGLVVRGPNSQRARDENGLLPPSPLRSYDATGQ